MGDDFEKKLDMIFERITAIMETKHEKKLDIMLRRINAIATSAAAFAALIISISSLNINFNTYSLTKEQVSLNTTENLALSVGNGNVDIVDLKQGEAEPELYYRAELSVCIINKSNLPISVVSGDIFRPDSENYARIFPNVYELDFPISMQPQETKNLDCYMLVKIPDFINEFIVEKFPEPSEVDFSTITKYLFFEKCTDLVGNKVIVKEKGGTTKFIMHLTLPFTLQLGTAKGNVFSTQFYEGGTQFFLDKEYADKLAEQYGSWGLEYSTEPIVDNTSKNHMSFWQFLKESPSIILIIVITIALLVFLTFIYVNFYILGKHQKQKWATLTTQNKQINLHTEHDDLFTEDEPDHGK